MCVIGAPFKREGVSRMGQSVLRELRKIKGLTQEALGKMVGVSRDTIRRWETEETYPGVEELGALARALETTASVLLEKNAAIGSGFPRETPGHKGGKFDENVTPIRQKLIAIPLYSKASEVCAGGGNVLPQPEIEMPFWVLEDWVGGPLAPKQVYAIRMEGDSMEPKIPAGSIVVVNPNTEVRSGDVAVVCIDDRMMVKQVFYRGNRIELNPLNPAYKAATFTQEELDGLAFAIQGKVTYWVKGGPVNGLD